MDHIKGKLPFLWWVKFILTLLVIVFSTLFTLPTFISNSSLKNNSFFHWLTEHVLPSNQVQLGLDLKGGVSLTLDVDLEGSLQESLDRALARVKETANAQNILIKEISIQTQHNHGATITIENPADAEKIIRFVSEQTDLLLYERTVAGVIYFNSNTAAIENFRTEIMRQAVNTIRNRIDQFGATEPSIFQENNKRIVVELPGLQDISRAKSLIGNTARLDFRLVLGDIPPGKLYELVVEAKKALEPSENEQIDSLSLAKYSEWLRDKKKIPAHSTILLKHVQQKTEHAGLYLVEHRSRLTGELVETARSGQSTDNYVPEYAVFLNFKPLGAKLFGDLTREAASPEHPPHQVAIILDDHVYSAPHVEGPILGGSARINMGGGLLLDEQKKEAEDLALVLRSGALPAKVLVVEERQIGPSEGAENIAAGINSSLLSAILVVLIMLAIYGKAGLVANAAMLINIFFILATMALFGATLTLPGIAGLVLTMAIAVDGNVIINERIREEIRMARSQKQAFYRGYRNSFTTLIDAHITTAVAGAILLIYGNPAVKGFAVTLLIGIVSTLFTSYYVTEVIGQWLVEKTKMRRFGI